MKTMKTRLLIMLSALPLMLLAIPDLQAQQPQTGAAQRRVIVFVWDGLRADDLTPDIAPNYFALARSGVVFADHHAVYPTFTMMNSASIATGTYPGVHGFYGNVVYAPSAKGRNAKGADIHFFCGRVHRGFWCGRSGARRLSGQAHACFDHAAGPTSERIDHSNHRQVRSSLRPGL